MQFDITFAQAAIKGRQAEHYQNEFLPRKEEENPSCVSCQMLDPRDDQHPRHDPPTWPEILQSP